MPENKMGIMASKKISGIGGMKTGGLKGLSMSAPKKINVQPK